MDAKKITPFQALMHIVCYKCNNVSAKRDASSSGSKNVYTHKHTHRWNSMYCQMY